MTTNENDTDTDDKSIRARVDEMLTYEECVQVQMEQGLGDHDAHVIAEMNEVMRHIGLAEAAAQESEYLTDDQKVQLLMPLLAANVAVYDEAARIINGEEG